MSNIKLGKKNKDREVLTFKVIKIVVGVICILTVLTMLFPLFNVYGTFDSKFVTVMKAVFEERGLESTDLTGLAITIKGYQFAFGVNEVTLTQPYQLITDNLLIACYMLPILLSLFLIPFKKLDGNKTYSIIKYCTMGFLMITFGIIFMIYVNGSAASFGELLLEKIPEYNFPIYSEVTVVKATFPFLFQLIYIVGGMLCLYLATNVKNIINKTKREK